MKICKQSLENTSCIDATDTKDVLYDGRRGRVFTGRLFAGLRNAFDPLHLSQPLLLRCRLRLIALVTVMTFCVTQNAESRNLEAFAGDESLSTVATSSGSRKLDFTVYLRIDALIKNQLYIDPGQEEFIDYLDISLGIDAYYGRFFIESNNQANRSNRSSTIGYRLFDDIDYQIDVLFGQTYLDGLSDKQGNIIRSEPSIELQGIRERDNEINQGFRFTKYNENYAWWVDIAGDPFNFSHGGWIIDSYVAQVFQVYNWEFHAGIGATFFSKEVVDYHAGIRADEATLARPTYEAGFGSRYSLDLSAQYPLSQNWVFVSGFTVKRYSNAFSNSPLYDSNQQKLLSVGVMYVW